MDNSLIMSIGCLIGVIVFKAGKMASEDLVRKISKSNQWPLDDWTIGALGLGYAHRMQLSRDEVLKRAKSSIVTANILIWLFLGASAFFGSMWLL